ncbi:Actin-like protein (Actin-related protein 2) [Scheffersomyces stipitis CBS 6054]|uniref:Actin-like protein (Actin-related protein 2) n=1 Tax=Scheffersomyces stipitis (strain ATCC 58785 / CBS 6054 / NBRC 10063 / NRRL Y-11545) TaxID=322104 RepID=A3M0P4_PICST|nr:Actin-like protein (Actin-related protein 2) [Scheffersomyces stipitis CBS 6054]ABN68568.2 Actin-like protein (Actin-related protein 2) [Scheffersomyces stipitis CBS 6054]
MYQQSGPNEYSVVIVSLEERSVSVERAGVVSPITVRWTNSNRTNSSVLQFPSFLELSDASLNKEETEELLRNTLETKHSKLAEIYTSELFRWCDFNRRGGINEVEERLIHSLLVDVCIEQLGVSPRECKVVFIDDGFSEVFKFQMIDILLSKLKFRSVIVQASPVLAIIGSNRDSGIVVDIGWSNCRIVPVIDLRDLTVNGRYQYPRKWNGLTLHYTIVEKLIELDDRMVNEKLLSRNDLFDIIANFIEKYIYVRPIEAQPRILAESFEIVEGVFLPNKWRYEIIEEMFFGKELISQQISSLVKSAHIDNRKVLLKNIILKGVIAEIAGFKTRLIQELNKEVNGTACGKVTLGSWSGCSTYVSSVLSKQDKASWKHLEITREAFAGVSGPNGYRLTGLLGSRNGNIVNIDI